MSTNTVDSSEHLSYPAQREDEHMRDGRLNNVTEMDVNDALRWMEGPGKQQPMLWLIVCEDGTIMTYKHDLTTDQARTIAMNYYRSYDDHKPPSERTDWT